MNYIVAVSGGVDSVVLLDMLVHKNIAIQQNSDSRGLTFKIKTTKRTDQLVVAHFDHGIREDSSADARFVAALAKQYGLPFETKRETLGPGASESTARERRYGFLRQVAKNYEAKLVTAHHLDDLVETIAINLTRGTGWRGLAVLSDTSIHRPLLHRTKTELYDYALAHGLEWVEDETNQQDAYLRNRIRRKAHNLPLSVKEKLLAQRDKQLDLVKQIDEEVERFVAPDEAYSRYFFTMIDQAVAVELLRKVTKGLLTRPRLLALLHGIKTAQPHTTQELGENVTTHFTRREFIVKFRG